MDRRSKRNITQTDQSATRKRMKLSELQPNFNQNNLDVSDDLLRWRKMGTARKESVSKRLKDKRSPMLGESSSFGMNKVAQSRNKNTTRNESSDSNGFNSLFDIAVKSKKISKDKTMIKINKGVNKDTPFKCKKHKDVAVSLIGKHFRVYYKVLNIK